jgi:endonuclease/exonuclease/phosphatase (EEP) superfamily protein YafD
VKRAIRRVAASICLLMVAFTGLALIETDEWWIRVLDFPRLQISAILALMLLVYWPLSSRGTVSSAIIIASLVALGWQVWLVIPYTPLWKQQMISADTCEPQVRVRFLIANVFQDNRNAESLLSLVRESDPDVILLTEIDKRWERDVGSLKEDYPATVLEPLSNTYGIGLYSRLVLKDAKVRYLVEDDIPSIRVAITLRNGTDFTMWGVHPAPPRPKSDTDQRDAELLLVAKEAAAVPGPAVVAGDLNDVAWSSTTTLFQKVSGLLDPRIGRGLYATFNANWPLLKWPLDHLFASKEWTLGEFRRLKDIGSDHYPILVELCHRPQAAAIQKEPSTKPSDLQKAEEHIEDGRKAVRE